MKSVLVDAREVEQLFGEKASRIYQLVREGVLPAGVVVRLGRRIKFHRTKLIEWMENGGQGLPGGWRRAADARVIYPRKERG